MLTSRSSLPPPLFLIAVLCLVACGGAGSNGAPVDPVTLAGKGDAVCARAESLSCPVPNCATHNQTIIGASQGAGWDCTAELAAYWECLGQNADCAWVGDRNETPSACVGVDTAYEDCIPRCSETFFSAGCSARCGGPPFAAECAESATGLDCTCTYGPRIGRTFTAAVPSCDAGQWLDMAREVCAS